MSSPVVVLDACVLFSAPLRNLLMHLAVHEIIGARWTEQIHAEWMNALERERPDLSAQRLERTKSLMNLHAPDCLVEGYEHRIESLQLPDPDDRHVLAAAIESEAQAVVTWNVSHFPASALKEHGLDIWTPDQLIMRLLDENRQAVIAAMREHRESLLNPPKTVDEYLNALRQQGLANSIDSLGGML